MKKSAFNYRLPAELIAQQPPTVRGDSRLLHLHGETGELADRQFANLPDLLEPGDLLVFNNTRVIPARLFGEKSTGGKVEVLIERLLDNNRALAHIRAGKSPKVGAKLRLESALDATMVARHDALFELDFGDGPPLPERLEQHGHMPLPPYIDRADEAADHDRYQTVFAAAPGAVAAPTAGLHFTDTMLAKLAHKGVKSAFVTLHVGAGTFQPMRTETVEEHVMHAEWLCVDEATVQAINDTKAAGGRIVAVGTTAVRSLETAARGGTLSPFSGDTRLFITPGYQYNLVDAMVTNFHLPESTLLMLVSAFAGYRQTLAAYQHAINQQYRFFSYGDAMFISRNPNASQDVPA